MNVKTSYIIDIYHTTIRCKDIGQFVDFLQTFEEIFLAKMAEWHDFLKALKYNKDNDFV